jgi:hypothetical protein
MEVSMPPAGLSLQAKLAEILAYLADPFQCPQWLQTALNFCDGLDGDTLSIADLNAAMECSRATKRAIIIAAKEVGADGAAMLREYRLGESPAWTRFYVLASQIPDAANAATPRTKSGRKKSIIRGWSDERLRSELMSYRNQNPDVTLSAAAKMIDCDRSTLTRKYNGDPSFRKWWDDNHPLRDDYARAAELGRYSHEPIRKADRRHRDARREQQSC